MVSLVQTIAKEERDSKLTDEMYQKFTMDMASYVLQAATPPKDTDTDGDNEKSNSSMTSKEVYNPELLDMCM